MDVRYDEAAISLLRESFSRQEGVCTFTSAGDSMTPLIRKGSRIVVHPCGANEVSPGDVVVFDSWGTLCCHRCMRIYREGARRVCLTKADVSWQCDEPFDASAVLGKVVFSSRMHALTNRLLAAFHCGGYSLRRLVRHAR